MTQENPNQQTPSTSKQDFSESTSEKEVLEPKSQNQPLWKRQIIKTIRGTIDVLESTVVKLENISESSDTDKISILSNFTGKLQSVWINCLNLVRKVLPKKTSAKLSDNTLTGMIIGVIILLLLIIPSVFSDSEPQELAVEPESQPQTESINNDNISSGVETPQITPEELSPLSPSQTLPETTPGETQVTTTQENQVEPETSEPEIQVNEETEKIKQETVESKSEMDSSPSLEIEEENPQKEEVQPQIQPLVKAEETIEEKVIPEPQETENILQENISTTEQLTPEQILIASIKSQLANIGKNNFDSEVIKSVKADFATSTLILTINNDWYSLKESEQDRVGTDILQRSKELDFNHTEIIDSQGTLIARDPVVGNEIIIFAR